MNIKKLVCKQNLLIFYFFKFLVERWTPTGSVVAVRLKFKSGIGRFILDWLHSSLFYVPSLYFRRYINSWLQDIYLSLSLNVPLCGFNFYVCGSFFWVTKLILWLCFRPFLPKNNFFLRNQEILCFFMCFGPFYEKLSGVWRTKL